MRIKLAALIGVVLVGLAVAGVVVLRSHPGRRGETRAAPSLHTGLHSATIRGTLLGVGGPVGRPRPLPRFAFRLVDRATERVVYVGRTDPKGRFLIRVRPGTYVFSMKGMVLVRRSGDVPLHERPLRVAAGATIRPRMVVTNPLWA
jgi:hypothetical protein